MKCINCEKEAPLHANYCNFDCSIEYAKKLGGQVLTPNGLPVTCIKADGTMLEHEHADHPTYMFPVDVEFVGERVELPEWDHSYENERHALIYADGVIALTVYECTYGLWSLTDGSAMRGLSFQREWRLTNDSIKKIKDLK